MPRSRCAKVLVRFRLIRGYWVSSLRKSSVNSRYASISPRVTAVALRGLSPTSAISPKNSGGLSSASVFIAAFGLFAVCLILTGG